MNVQEVIDYVKDSFGDDSGVQIDDADIRRWINAAQRHIVMQNESILEAVATQNIIKDQQVYTLPSDLLVLRSLRIKTEGMSAYKRIPHYSLQQFDDYINGWDGSSFTGMPYVYTTYKDEIFIFPTPDRDATDGLKTLYSQSPADIGVATTELSLPFLYHNAIVEYCLGQAHTKDEDYEAATIHKAQYNEDVRSLSGREQQPTKEHYPTITTRLEDM